MGCWPPWPPLSHGLAPATTQGDAGECLVRAKGQHRSTGTLRPPLSPEPGVQCLSLATKGFCFPLALLPQAFPSHWSHLGLPTSSNPSPVARDLSRAQPCQMPPEAANCPGAPQTPPGTEHLLPHQAGCCALFPRNSKAP